MSGITQKIVGPHNCALAFTIPLTEDDFLRDLHTGSGKDFVKTFARENVGIRAELLWKYYKPQAELALRIAAEVERLGVKTVFNLKLDELNTVIMGSDVTTLVAHWRAPLFTSDDLLNPSSLIARIKESKNEVPKLLRAGLSLEVKERLTNFDESAKQKEPVPEFLLKELNRLLAEAGLHPELRSTDSSVATLYHPEYRMHLNREALEDAFTGEFKGGSRVEFFDGLYPIGDVIEQISPEYDRLLDLTICNSILLGQAIKSQRRRCMVIANQDPTTFDFRLIFYQHVIKELARKNNSYLDIVIKLRKRLADH